MTVLNATIKTNRNEKAADKAVFRHEKCSPFFQLPNHQHFLQPGLAIDGTACFYAHIVGTIGKFLNFCAPFGYRPVIEIMVAENEVGGTPQFIFENLQVYVEGVRITDITAYQYHTKTLPKHYGAWLLNRYRIYRDRAFPARNLDKLSCLSHAEAYTKQIFIIMSLTV